MSATVVSFEAEAERVRMERERLKLAYPEAFADGARRAFKGDMVYPPGFAAWPFERKNSWYAGYNVGRCDRARLERVGDG
jgi:hypothetical protein